MKTEETTYEMLFEGGERLKSGRLVEMSVFLRTQGNLPLRSEEMKD